MPTPIGHTLTAAIIYTISRRKYGFCENRQAYQKWMQILFCIILSSLPDIDFISISSCIRFSWENHHGPTHSIGFVILVMLVAGVTARIFQKNWKGWGTISGICVLLHILMDLLVTKNGLILFYPLSTHRIILATGFPFGYAPGMGFVSFVVMSAVEEMVVLGSILLVVWWRSTHPCPSQEGICTPRLLRSHPSQERDTHPHPSSSILLCLCALILLPQQLLATTLPQSLPLTITIAPLEITTTEDGYQVVRADGCGFASEVGQPMLPVKTFFVLLPQGSDVSGLEITSIQQERLSGRYKLKAVSPPRPVSGGHKLQETILPAGTKVEATLCGCPILRGCPIATATSQNIDGEVVKLESIQQWGGFRLAALSVFGARYDAQSGELIWVRRLEFNLKLKACPEDTACNRCPNPQAIQKMVINPELIPLLAPALSAPSQRYLIVTNETLAPAFQRLLDSKTARGLEGTITTTDWIYSHSPGRDHQEMIRNYIRDYQPTYLLLGGDTDVVPYRGVYAWVEGGTLVEAASCRLSSMASANDKQYSSLQPSALDGKPFWDANIPCDMYYACLDGDWDYDKDGIYGEVEDRVDMLPEVFVGRAPVSIYSETEDFVAKVLEYGSATGSYPYNEVLIGCVFDRRLNDGKLIMQAIDEISPGAYARETYYQSEGATEMGIISGLNAGIGLVAHAGHGSDNCLQMGGNYFYTYELGQLSNPYPFVFNSIGCYAGSFDTADTDCIGEQMVMRKDAGAAAFIGNSRYGLYDETSPILYSGEYQIEFFRQALREGCSRLGEALAMSKLSFVPQCGTSTPYRWVQYCLNLLGDPEMALPQPGDVQALYQVIQGNVQGIASVGQQLPLVITLKNFRVSDCGSLSVTLTTDDPYVVVTTPTVTLDPLQAGETASNINQPFGFMLKPDCPYEHRIRFALTINDGTGTATDTIYLTVSLKVSDMYNIICYPNPCIRQDRVTIANIPPGSEAAVCIYNLAGELIRQLRATELSSGGSMVARWDTKNDSGENVASGIYLYRLVSSSGVKTGKIGIVR